MRIGLAALGDVDRRGGLYAARLVFERRAVDTELAAAAAPLAALQDVAEMRTAEVMCRHSRRRGTRGGQALATSRASTPHCPTRVLTAYTWRADGSAGVRVRVGGDALAAFDRTATNPASKARSCVKLWPATIGSDSRSCLGGQTP